ncbi:hypothetical protein VCHC61A2_3617 [Vibrio cholerae HC-61A2]|nr:hypothetical protein VCHC1A2_0006 [Vibrio cholerae HC-1A2]EKL24000.1 hypothetical protein VCHC61A2_3617 [Vibrio cholerae HC-61A2]
MPTHPVRDGSCQLGQLRGGGRTGAVQAQFAPRQLGGFHVHAVEPQHVEVDVQVQRAAETLDQRHRAALGAGAVDAGLIGQPAGDHALHDAQHRANGFWLAGEQETQGVRKAQHPLPHRPRAEHLLDQVPRTLGHASRAATRAEPALLAGEGHQPLCTAVLAHHPQEAVLEYAATQVGIERLADIPGQRAALRFDPCNEVRVVRLYQRVQQRALGRVARVPRTGVGGRQWRASRGLPPGCGEARHAALRCGDGCSVLRLCSHVRIGAF